MIAVLVIRPIFPTRNTIHVLVIHSTQTNHDVQLEYMFLSAHFVVVLAESATIVPQTKELCITQFPRKTPEVAA